METLFPEPSFFSNPAPVAFSMGFNDFPCEPFLTPDTSSEVLSEDSMSFDNDVSVFSLPFVSFGGHDEEDPMIAMPEPPMMEVLPAPVVSNKRPRKRHSRSSTRGSKRARTSRMNDISDAQTVQQATGLLNGEGEDFVSLQDLLDAGIIAPDDLESIKRRIRHQSKPSNESLRSQNSSLRAENADLKKEIKSLRSRSSKIGAMVQLFRQGANLLTQATTAASQGKGQGVKPGVVLLILLLSFGMIFNNNGVLPRTFLRGPIAGPSSLLLESKYSTYPSDKMVVDTTPPGSPPTSREISEDYHPVTEWRANTTYLVCPTIKQLTPPPSAPLVGDPTTSPTISFLIPPDSMGSSDSQEVMEVTCSVVSMKSLPLSSHS
eukprot:TRINITY_DN7349_c0_g1_i1.p1 TRINITY_DN7349_c0_g1~~TRINITY_DN7349_c0_g1_i1.p1  ORF type:complete len:376 (-),score=86.46 TRINITY_DN7349_c0_g1_i1:277-1404(-)